MLAPRFSANVQALARHYAPLAHSLKSFIPAQMYRIQPTPDGIQLGVSTAAGINPLPHPLPAPTAANLLRQLYPAGLCSQPVLIAGEDMGWLWNALYQLPCQSTAAPGHRPPLFFLMRDIERLWVILHLHDWRELLADARIRLFVGNGCLDQFRQSLIAEPSCPWPRLSVRVDPSVWTGNPTLDEMLADATAKTNENFLRCTEQFRSLYSATSPDSIASQFRSGRSLKVLGITSRFTTFLQHSMRDWLAAFHRLGHQTQLVIEESDHQFCNGLTIASACADFRPDLVVIIDHYRAELGGIPPQIPVVMWVQDALPNIFRREAGIAQGELDYAMGFARLRMIHEFAYPPEHYMPAVVGCDEQRFQPRQLSEKEQSDLSCDVSYVSHASATAEALLKSETDRANAPEVTQLLGAIFEQLRAVYTAGGIVTEPVEIRKMIDLALAHTRMILPDTEMPKLMDLFTQRINNALFRHQTLNWLADTGVNLRLYGRGWENHPTLSRFARGIADNVNHLSMIYQASKISLHVSPHGAVHQRVMEGLASGALMMIRHCPGDVIERRFQEIWNWCLANNIFTDSHLRSAAEPHIAAAISAAADDLKLDPFNTGHPFIETLRASAQGGYIRSAGTVWGEDYDAVAFRSAEELRQKIAYFLSDEHDRRRIADSMRQVVLDRFTYLATCRQILNFIADDLAASSQQKVAA